MSDSKDLMNLRERMIELSVSRRVGGTVEIVEEAKRFVFYIENGVDRCCKNHNDK